MGYQPRFNQAEEPVKKTSPGKVILVLAVSLASLALTLGLLLLMFLNVGRPNAAANVKSVKLEIMDTFDAYMDENVEALRLSLQPGSSNQQEQPDVSGEGTKPAKKTYAPLRDEDLVAPEPNQALFGATSDREVLKEVIAQAEEILEGQTLYFNPETTEFVLCDVRYYLDDTIFAIAWKEGHDGAAYTMAEVKVADASQIRRHLADGEYGSSKQYYATEMAATVNAVVASAGDFYSFRDWGTEVYQGRVRALGGSYAETCYIDINGDMHFTYPKPFASMDQAQAFVDENNIRFSLCFGPILVDNYEIVEHDFYYLGEPNEEYARGALCQMDKLHYLSVTANFDKGHNRNPTVKTFQKNIAATGCKMAYCLDGGQTATIVMNDELVNRPAKGEQRRISDIIYFATAIPEGG